MQAKLTIFLEQQNKMFYILKSDLTGYYKCIIIAGVAYGGGQTFDNKSSISLTYTGIVCGSNQLNL